MRTIKVNGKTIKFENFDKIPLPRTFQGGRAKSDFRLAMEQMEPGESAWFDFDKREMNRKNSALTLLNKAQSGKRYCYRAENGGYRIYCTEVETATPKLEAVGW